jgi:hypothetical protein
MASNSQRRVELKAMDVLVYKGMELDRGVLDAIMETNSRLLWAFMRDGDTVRAVPYSEDQVIWMAESDILKEQDVEI